jgi:hypothetical protein
VHGPLGFCDLDKQGMLVEGFEEMGSIITYYHHPYYKEHMKLHGYKKDVDWFEFEIDLENFNQEDRLNKVSDRALEKEGLTILQIKSRNDFKPYFSEIFGVLDIAFKDLYGVVELTDKQVKTYIEQYFSFEPRLYMPYRRRKQASRRLWHLFSFICKNCKEASWKVATIRVY